MSFSRTSSLSGLLHWTYVVGFVVLLSLLSSPATLLVTAGTCDNVRIVQGTLPELSSDRSFFAAFNHSLVEQLPSHLHVELESEVQCDHFYSSDFFTPSLLLKGEKNEDAEEEKTASALHFFGKPTALNWGRKLFYTEAEELLEFAFLLRHAVTVLRVKRLGLFDALPTPVGAEQAAFQAFYLGTARYTLNVDYILLPYSTAVVEKDYEPFAPQVLVCTDMPQRFAAELVASSVLLHHTTLMGSLRYPVLRAAIEKQRLEVGLPPHFDQRVYVAYTDRLSCVPEGRYLQKQLLLEDPLGPLFAMQGWLAGTAVAEALAEIDDSGRECTIENLQEVLRRDGVASAWEALVSLAADEEEPQESRGNVPHCQAMEGLTAFLTQVYPVQKKVEGPVEKDSYMLHVPRSDGYFDRRDVPTTLPISFLRYEDGVLYPRVPVTIEYIHRVIATLPPGNVEMSAAEFILSTNMDSPELSAIENRVIPGPVVVGSTSQNIDLSEYLQVGLIRSSQYADAEFYDPLDISVTPNLVPSIWYAFALATEIFGEEMCDHIDFVNDNIFNILGFVEEARSKANCGDGTRKRKNLDTMQREQLLLTSGSVRGFHAISPFSDSVGENVNYPPYAVNVSSFGEDKLTVTNGSGPGRGDPTAIAMFLERNPEAAVFVYFADFVVDFSSYEKELQSASRSVRERLYTITNLPRWDDNSTAAEEHSPLLRSFHLISKREEWTPHHLIVFTSLLLVDQVAQLTEDYSASGLADAIYQQEFLDIEGLALQYSKTERCLTGSETQYINGVPCHNLDSLDDNGISQINVEEVVETPEPAKELNSKVAWRVIWIVLLILLILLLLLLLAWWVTQWVVRRYRKYPESSDHITYVVFDFTQLLSKWKELEGSSAASTVSKGLTKVIDDAIIMHGLYKVDAQSTDTEIHACTDGNPWRAVHCCVDVQCTVEKKSQKPKYQSSVAPPVKVSMGISTGKINVVREGSLWRGVVYGGWCYTEAVWIARELSKGLILAVASTCKQARVEQMAAVYATGPYTRRMPKRLVGEVARINSADNEPIHDGGASTAPMGSMRMFDTGTEDISYLRYYVIKQKNPFSLAEEPYPDTPAPEEIRIIENPYINMDIK